MGMHAEAPEAPDTFGLPEYFISDVFTEIVGGNVRLVCGARVGRDIHWRYSVVMPAEKLLRAALQCHDAAEEAYNITQLMDRRSGH